MGLQHVLLIASLVSQNSRMEAARAISAYSRIAASVSQHNLTDQAPKDCEKWNTKDECERLNKKDGPREIWEFQYGAGRPTGENDVAEFTRRILNGTLTPTSVRPGGSCGGSFTVLPWSAIGQVGTTYMGGKALVKEVRPRPTMDDVILDSTTLDLINDDRSIENSDGDSEMLYFWLGLIEDGWYPAGVDENIGEFKALLHVYPGKTNVIHVTEPDFRFGWAQSYAYPRWPTETRAQDVLAECYGEVLKEFAKTGKTKLKLVPISDGDQNGGGGYGTKSYKPIFTRLTYHAWKQAVAQATGAAAEAIKKADVEMCISDPQDMEDFLNMAKPECESPYTPLIGPGYRTGADVAPDNDDEWQATKR